jgi:glycosyltransferase involved in cell wall biosynthesis
MKICVFSDDFPPYARGGAGIVAATIARGYVERGHQVVVLTTVQERSVEGTFQEEGLVIERVYSQYPGRWRAWKSLYNSATVPTIKRLLTEIKPDVVHAHNVHAHLSYYVLKLAKQSGARVLLTAHDCMAFHYGKFTEYIDPAILSIPSRVNYKISVWKQILVYRKRYNPFRNLIIRHYLAYCDSVCAVSKALRDALIANSIKVSHVVYNGINVNQWERWAQQAPDRRKRLGLGARPFIGFVGKTSNVKGFQQVLRSLAKTRESVPEVQLLVMGADALTPSAELLARELELTDAVVCSGWLSGPDLVAAYRACTVIVFPSLCLDTFGMVNVEAMLSEKPVVTTCFGGSPEVVEDGVTATVVNPLDVERFAEALIEFLEDPIKTRAFGRAGRARVEKKFTLGQQIDTYLALMKPS